MNIGFAMCGSFCTFSKALDQMEMLSAKHNIIPIMSDNAYNTSTRFGKAEDIRSRIEDITEKEIIHSIVDAEPLGPKGMVDMVLVEPCTGNTAAKIALGITDTPVTMAVKSVLRIGIPVVLCVASNDALAASAQNIGRLLNTKNIFLVPLQQDDPEKKPSSLVADFTLTEKAIEAAEKKIQLQPIFIKA